MASKEVQNILLTIKELSLENLSLDLGKYKDRFESSINHLKELKSVIDDCVDLILENPNTS